jgi:hypothetical protein
MVILFTVRFIPLSIVFKHAVTFIHGSFVLQERIVLD